MNIIESKIFIEKILDYILGKSDVHYRAELFDKFINTNKTKTDETETNILARFHTNSIYFECDIKHIKTAEPSRLLYLVKYYEVEMSDHILTLLDTLFKWSINEIIFVDALKRIQKNIV